VFESVLVANRGEIAVRIIRTLRALGMRPVAVYSDADIDARHVRAADIAIRLGPAPARESYLSVERVVDAARAAGVDALHPGYGFLAESAALAAACAAAGVVFVGPPPEAIEVMGDKIRARRVVAAAGVPVVPGRDDRAMSDVDLAAAAAEIGFPVLLKPSAGGGGKGMRLVDDPAELPAATAASRREAQVAFGDDTLFVERYVPRPRHIEIQVLADQHGNVVHLGERECSLQRRHQKVVEESPSPFVAQDTRAAMGERAVAATRACGYANAGTIELIVSGDDPDAFYFIEMNTRLQVEHPVTELVTGIDLVEWQLRIAAGEPLPWEQDDIASSGHAIEARVYAEDPDRDFLPTGGTVRVLHEPGGPGVRVDSGIAVGDEVTSYYDPMLAKVIAHGADRAAALHRLDRALGDTVLLGVTTNLGFLHDLLRDPAVVAGELDTHLVERVTSERAPASPSDVALAAAALLVAGAAEPPATDPWAANDAWRLTGPAWTVLQLDGREVRTRCAGGRDETEAWADARADGAESTIQEGWLVAIDGADPVAAALDDLDGGLELRFGGVARPVVHARDGARLWVAVDGGTWEIGVAEPGHQWPEDAGTSVRGPLGSPMPGTVVAVSVVAGQRVAAGTPLVIVEAMKMEHTVSAAADASVESVHVEPGQQVALGEPLVTLAPLTDAADEQHT
jgi:acetyl-CoA/propionyl-CoA carboxylase biotin carboxyl carrier protein